jgi:tetratricopeptide (TPR) repeat protein
MRPQTSWRTAWRRLTRAIHCPVESYPRISSGYNLLAVGYSQEGQYEKAMEITRQAVRLASDNVGLYENLANYALALQRFDETWQIIREAQARKLDDFAFHNALYALAFLGSDSAAMAEQRRWFAGQPEYENYGLALASDTEAYWGHLGKARELTKRAVDSAIRADRKGNGAVWQANAALQQTAYGNSGRGFEACSRESGRRGRSGACREIRREPNPWRKTWGNASHWTRRCSRFGCLRFGDNWRWTKRTRLSP